MRKTLVNKQKPLIVCVYEWVWIVGCGRSSRNLTYQLTIWWFIILLYTPRKTLLDRSLAHLKRCTHQNIDRFNGQQQLLTHLNIQMHTILLIFDVCFSVFSLARNRKISHVLSRLQYIFSLLSWVWKAKKKRYDDWIDNIANIMFTFAWKNHVISKKEREKLVFFCFFRSSNSHAVILQPINKQTNERSCRNEPIGWIGRF